MMRRSARARFLFAPAFVIGALLARPSAALAQCAMCGAAAASSRGVARGLAFSIFFLLGTLFLVVGWLVVLVLRTQARARPRPRGTFPQRRLAFRPPLRARSGRAGLPDAALPTPVPAGGWQADCHAGRRRPGRVPASPRARAARHLGGVAPTRASHTD